MAAHNVSVAQNSVNERRLRPIYDWLDNGNNKKALQEAEKVLKKQPDFPCCKVLKSLALIRMGKEEEAEHLIDSVLTECPTDESTLQAMSIAYRELQQPEKICTVYENAVKKDPTNEEWLSHLFMSYARLGNYKRQQQVAMALYKAKPKMPYYFWGVMSVLLQATNSGDEKLAANVTLPLAERMMAVMDKDGKIKMEQETRLYLMILEFQHKFQDALNVLEGSLGAQLEEQTSHLDYVENKKIEYLKKLDKWDKVNSLALEMLQKSEDHWNLYLDYITSVFRLLDGGDEGVSVDAALVFIGEQQKKFPKNRGPFLAQIELQTRQLARKGDDSETERRLRELLVSYFDRFSSKSCCGLDLKLYLPSLGKDEVSKFFEETLLQIDLDQNKVPKTVIDIHKHVCWHQLKRLSGFHHDASVTEEDKCAIIDELCRLYISTSSLMENYSPTEIRPHDAYIVLAAHLMWQLWSETSNDKYFWKAVVYLQSALDKSPASYHFRFLLIKFFNQIGAVGVSHNVYTGLELKHIQLDSLGHIMTRHIPTCGHFVTQSTLFGNTLKFFTGNYKDTVDYIISAYRCGSFDKILEFIKLRDRLAASQHYTSLTVERMLLDLLLETSLHGQTVQMMSYLENDPDKDEINWSELTDNRDFKAMQSWDPPERSVSDDLISDSFLTEQKFLFFRSTTIRSLVAAVYMSEDIHPARVATSNKEQKQNGNGPSSDQSRSAQMSTIIVKLVDQLVKHLEEIRSQNSFQIEDFVKYLNPVQGPDRSRLVLYVGDQHPDFLVELLRLVLATHQIVSDEEDQKSKHQQMSSTICPRVVDLFASIVDRVKVRITDKEKLSLIHREQHLESIVNIIESSNFACIVCGVCQSLLLSSKASSATTSSAPSGKKTKKKKEVKPDLAEVVKAFNGLVIGFQTNLRKLLSISGDLENLIALDKLAIAQEKFSDLNLDPTASSQLTNGPEIQEKTVRLMEASYNVSFLQMKATVQKKLNYFANLLIL